MVNRRISSILFLTLLISSSYSSAEDVDDFDDALVEDSPLLSPTSPADPEPVIDIPYTSPIPLNPSSVYFSDHFDDLGHFHRTWVQSAARKASLDSPSSNSEEDLAQYDGVWALEAPQRDALHGDKGLVLKSKAKHAAIAAKLSKVFRFEGKELVVQYEVTLQDGQECGGAYLKLLSEGGDGVKNLAGFTDKTPYTIMFGPDKCGNDHKLHFIFRHRNPLNSTISEKHCKKPKERLEDAFADKQPHLYTLIVRPDSTYEVLLDRKVMNAGSLLEDFSPSVNPPAEIEDVSDRKPVEWDEREKVGDPEAVKPAAWDEDAPAQVVDEGAIMPDGWLENEPTHIADPAAIKPLDWDTEMDGEWEAPLIDNPQCVEAVGCGKWEPPLINNPNFKGKWRAPLIDNPNYKGKWRPRLVSNPDYYEDKEPYKMQPIAAIGFELWSMSKDILFDNLIITDDKEVADQWASETFDKKQLKIAKDSGTLWGRAMKKMNYSPRAWGVYFLYCAIPVGIYIRYLVGMANEETEEESVIQKLANITNEYPALWALYIVILGIPVVFVLYLCCKPSSSSASQSQEKGDVRRSAEKKKTDEVTEDDVDVVKEPQDGGGGGDAEEEKEEEEEEEEDDPAEKNSGPEDEEEESKEEVVPATLKKEETAPRKRKARKE